MALYSPRLVRDMQTMPGARHSFLSQVCASDGRRHRNALESLAQEAGPALAERAADSLTSLDNRRFFQGYAEVVTTVLMGRSAYRVQELRDPGPMLRAKRLTGGGLNISVLSFIHKSRLISDSAAIQRLVEALDRVGGSQRLVVVVHKWLPIDFDTDEVRRAVDSWLAEVDKGFWDGRYATFIDEKKGIHLEFGLTGRTTRRGSRVCLAIGPFVAPASLAAVEDRVLGELDRYRLGPHAQQPLVLACVADQPWSVSRGYMREFLYGQARCMEMIRDGERCDMEMEYAARGGPTCFRDPLYRDLSALLWLGRDQRDPTTIHARAYLNPWASEPLDASSFPFCPVLSVERWNDENPVLRWKRRDEKVKLI